MRRNLRVLVAAVWTAGAAAREPIVTASSTFNADFAPELAVDGRPDTRWASGPLRGAPQWIAVDFGAPTAIRSVRIRWEAAFAVEYALEVSEEGTTWRELARRADGQGKTETLKAPVVVTARQMRVIAHRAGPHPHVSIWELEFPDGEGGARLAAARAERERRLRAEALDRCRAAGIREVVFAARERGPDGHWYANFSYYAESERRVTYRNHGRLAALDLETGRIRMILEDPEGTIRDPAVHYDGRTIVFSWRRAGTSSFHLYEIQSDGSGLRRLTDGGGPYDDIEPCWLPDDRIVFVSSRCRRWVNCWLTQVAILHRCERDGSGVVPLSANIEHDNTPWPLPDGRVMYMRWEYIDRSQVHYHHLWAMNPDGTGQQVVFGNLHPGGVYIDARPMPDGRRIAMILSPGHGQAEHAGHVATVDPRAGPDDLPRLRTWTRGADYRDPWPVDDGLMLAARGRLLVAVYADGQTVPLYELGPEFGPAWLHEPRPLAPRTRERRVADRADWSVATGEFVLSDVYEGRNMAGVQRGEIRELLVLESLPKPINYTGGMEPLSYGGTFTLERIVGTVPVEADGSARFELPALRSYLFVALDAQGRSVKRMQSFTTVMPGERLGCVGCHEPRTQAAPNREGRAMPLALTKPAARPRPVEGVPEVPDFPRDVQPILDALCVSCHGYEESTVGGPRAGRLILTGDRGPMYSHAYYMITVAGLVADGRNNPRSNYPPRALGSSASRLLAKMDGSHHGVRATPAQERIVRMWIECGAPYPGTYAALGTGMIGGYHENQPVHTDWDWPTTKAAAKVIDRRCAVCHAEPHRSIPRALSDERGVSFWRPDWNDPRLLTSRHIVFNLSRPEKSLVLLAPLAKEAGGWGLCTNSEGRAVFASREDADYRTLLAMVEAGRAELERIGRFDMPQFRPRPEYLREMKRYGVWDGNPSGADPVNPYELDRRYWEAVSYRPLPVAGRGAREDGH
ncbi:MAG: discoidin domain-containing protein [Kiritimatiellae bacterium]|nr:discoidin domain-containing protein [Kiritimatiellia bacterium]